MFWDMFGWFGFVVFLYHDLSPSSTTFSARSGLSCSGTFSAGSGLSSPHYQREVPQRGRTGRAVGLAMLVHAAPARNAGPARAETPVAAEGGPLGMRDQLELGTRDRLELEMLVAAERGLQPEMRDRLELEMRDRLEPETSGGCRAEPPSRNA